MRRKMREPAWRALERIARHLGTRKIAGTIAAGCRGCKPQKFLKGGRGGKLFPYAYGVVQLIIPSSPKAGRAENVSKCAWAR